MYSKIMVPVDGSEPSNLALDEAIKLARSLNASLVLLNLVEVGALLMSEGTAASYDALFDMLRREGAEVLSEAAAKVSRAGLPVESILVEDPPGQVGACIVHEARERHIDLIVCGTHGRRGVRRLLMGSDAEYIVRHAPVPVLLVRLPDAAQTRE